MTAMSPLCGRPLGSRVVGVLARLAVGAVVTLVVPLHAGAHDNVVVHRRLGEWAVSSLGDPFLHRTLRKFARAVMGRMSQRRALSATSTIRKPIRLRGLPCLPVRPGRTLAISTRRR